MPYKTLCGGLALIALMARLCPAQTGIEPKTVESWLRDEMVQSSGDSKLTLLNGTLRDYQKAGLITWAYEQVSDAAEAGQVDQVLALGEKLMDLDPNNIEIALRSLKLAQAKQDAVGIQKWSEIAAQTADCILSSPQTGELGKKRAELARAMGGNRETQAYSEILQTQDPGQKQARIEKFVEHYKTSHYRPALEDLYLEAANKSGDSRKTLAAAKKILEWNDRNVVAWMVVAESYMQSGREAVKLKECATKVLALLEQQAKPEGLTEAQWSRKKAVLTGRAYWMAGRASMQEDKYAQADISLRAALPYLKGDNRVTSDALFFLAWANYEMHNYSDAMRFNTECMRIDGPYRGQAAKNLEVFRSEAAPKSAGSNMALR
jgi:predicted negative regulator of RcsB-dependent stress response